MVEQIERDMLEKLDKTKDKLLSEVCDRCRWPFECGQTELEAKCGGCPVADTLELVLSCQRTATAIAVTKIVQEEMMKGDKKHG